MAPWVKLPGDADAARRAALDELRLTLGAVECAVELLIASDSSGRSAPQIAEAILRQLDRGRRALRRLSG